MKSRILHGETQHCRHRPRVHSFRYRMFWLGLDLDELAMLDQTVTGFGHNRRSWASIHDRDYAGPGPGSIRAKITNRLIEGGVSEPTARITLYTLPRVCGYVFNPVSFYFCYRPDETLVAVVAEVHNTFGEGHHYVLRPEVHHEPPGESIRFRAAKSFYVSPFLEVSGTYEVLVCERDDGLRLQIQLEQGGELMFTATMTGRTVPMNSRTLARTLFRLPFLAATVMLRIHWQALQLSMFKHLRVFPRSHTVAAATFAAVPSSFWHRLRASAVDRAFRKQAPARHCEPTVIDGEVLMSAHWCSLGNPIEDSNATDPLVRGIEARHQAVLRRIRRDGVFGLGETYVEGDWFAPQLDKVLYAAFTAPMPPRSALARLKWLVAIVEQRLFNRQSGRGAFDIGSEHYDLGNDLFRAMLDDTMTYTCGVWANASTLNEAQQAKLELICRKLDLRPGLHVLDIGCGWGNFARYAAERFGVKVTGITVSQQQADVARQRCHGLPVEIRFQDYRELNETFDRIVSIEMIEAVGRRNLAAFYRVVDRCLKNDGIFVLQAISGDTLSRTSHRAMDEFVLWLLKNIFPNGYLPKQHELVAPRDTSLRIDDWESFGSDYDRTLQAWAANFNAAWDQLQHRYDDVLRRRWNFYLHGCMAAFRARRIHVYQIVYSKGGGSATR